LSHRTVITLVVAINFVLIASPVALVIYAWRGWRHTSSPSVWRKWTTLAGLSSESVACLAMPVLMLILLIHKWASWIDRIEIAAMADVVLVGIAASLIAMPLAVFAWGRIRWLTLPACLLTLFACYGAGMSMTY